jgi:hypothetical protein
VTFRVESRHSRRFKRLCRAARTWSLGEWSTSMPTTATDQPELLVSGFEVVTFLANSCKAHGAKFFLAHNLPQ